MNTTCFRSRELKLTFLIGNDNIRRQRAALTRDILVLQQHFTTFKAEQWSYFPQTRIYHADIFEKATQNLARVCILAFSRSMRIVLGAGEKDKNSVRFPLVQV